MADPKKMHGDPTLVGINADVRKTEAALQARREALVKPFIDSVMADTHVGGEEVARRLAPALYALMKGMPTAGQKPKLLRPLPDQKVA